MHVNTSTFNITLSKLNDNLCHSWGFLMYRFVHLGLLKKEIQGIEFFKEIIEFMYPPLTSKNPKLSDRDLSLSVVGKLLPWGSWKCLQATVRLQLVNIYRPISVLYWFREIVSCYGKILEAGRKDSLQLSYLILCWCEVRNRTFGNSKKQKIWIIFLKSYITNWIALKRNVL